VGQKNSDDFPTVEKNAEDIFCDRRKIIERQVFGKAQIFVKA
jgi:hypothetical protein